jgi:hypothetical protein
VWIITRSERKCVAGGNWTQDLGSDTMLDNTSSVSPTIKPRWYSRGEGGFLLCSNISPTACQPGPHRSTWGPLVCVMRAPPYELLYVRIITHNGICVVGLEIEISWFGYHVRVPSSASPTIQSRWYGSRWGASYAMVQQYQLIASLICLQDLHMHEYSTLWEWQKILFHVSIVLLA